MTNRTYPEHVKFKIAETRNPNFFPDLNIPRSTACYWIKKSNQILSSAVHKKHLDLLVEIEYLKSDVNQLSSENSFLKEVLNSNSITLKNREVTKRPDKEQTLDLIKNKHLTLKLTDKLSMIGLSIGRYRK